jgi:hypothetical protein
VAVLMGPCVKPEGVEGDDPRLTGVPVPVGKPTVIRVLINKASAPPPPLSITPVGEVTIPAGMPTTPNGGPAVLAGEVIVTETVPVGAVTSCQTPELFGADPGIKSPPAVSTTPPDEVTLPFPPQIRLTGELPETNKFPKESYFRSIALLVPPRKLCVVPVTIGFPA